MKKKLILYSITIIVALLIALTLYNRYDQTFFDVIDNKTVTVFQLGVFKEIDNAKEFINKNNIGYLFFDGDYYRVYSGITINNIKLNEEYLESLNLNYYEKKIGVNKNFYNLVKEYDSLTNGINALKSTNKDLIETYLETIN